MMERTTLRASSRRRLLQLGGAAAALGFASRLARPAGAVQDVGSVTRAEGSNAVLQEMLAFIPLSLVEENFTEGMELATFGDIGLRLETVGIDINALAGDEAVRTLARSTMPVPFGRLTQGILRADDPEALFGWTLTDVRQSLFTLASGGGEGVEIIRGTFDRAQIEEAWAANGYELLDVGDQQVASLSAEPTIDMESEISRIALSGANNVALVDDSTLIFCSSLDGLTAVLDAGRGQESSLGTDPMVNELIDAVPDALSGASLLPGGAFITQMPIGFSEEGELELGDLPEPGPIPLMGLIGFVSGPAVPESDLTDSPADLVPSGGKMFAVRRFLTAEEADLAARRSLIGLETGVSVARQMPYAEMFAGWRVSIPAEEIVLVEADLYANESIWLQMIYTRDAGFLYG
jgi:hypothetical protein